jgi:hypothetical protein
LAGERGGCAEQSIMVSSWYQPMDQCRRCQLTELVMKSLAFWETKAKFFFVWNRDKEKYKLTDCQQD